MVWRDIKRAIHAPGETKRELCLRLGRTPPEFLSGEDQMKSRMMRAKRQKTLKRAIAKGQNPYLVDHQYPEGEFWPYGAERRLGVQGWGVVKDGYYFPYNNHDYGYPNPEEEEAERWAELQEEAYMAGMHPEEFMDMMEMEERRRDERQRWPRDHHNGHPRGGSYRGGHHPHRNPHHYGHGEEYYY
jgi:hypothetical protein